MLLLGKNIANSLLQTYQKTLLTLPRSPHLVAILIGDHPASHTYVAMKEKACTQVGMRSSVIKLEASISLLTLLQRIDQLNEDPLVDGILIQLPLPPHLDPTLVMQHLDPSKDVDGFHPLNMGKLLLGQSDGFVPCTPLGIQTLLNESKISLAGQHVVIVGRSSIVGKPLAALLVQKHPQANATVTLAHSHSRNLFELTATADVLVAALGHPRFIKAHAVKQGAVVIDVGITREQGKLVGDVDFEEVAPKCRAITPVPGGVGPMTVAMLVHNTLVSCQRRCKNY
ncbi:MAG: bifunctional 5,10-methylenetetrahydrofolate dehydrogenase/5,10-methenyltetrahydrofolate cyclohydrolase [Verrucomicrobia bacterium]|nr:bifunctional 5,10-methylenetetrahydrofolate dehydrogenase/5,10-methenyltetrahydrofolate cyclohydrolase [Verrucomicrobiota bacterium]MBS0647260.1 bifunctional 5,10-methylenetetrahydrofolate dehydrogenase/5,10-methenyltetrahydrofolate cyclohydrolase [Verrucomicrobiota bacterium]